MSLLGMTRACAAILFLTATAASLSSLAAEAPPTSPAPAGSPASTAATTPQKSILKNSVTLVGANDANDALLMAAPLGTPLSLILFVKEPPAGHPRGELRIFPFSTQGEQPPAIATAKIRTAESNAATAAGAGDSAPVALDKPGQSTFSLNFDRLRSGKTYKGQLVLIAGDLLHHWDISLTTGARGTIAVDPVGTLKFVRWPCGPIGSFSFTLYDKSEGGPYHHVRVRFEPSAAANSKGLTSNFTLDTLSFLENGRPVDLEWRDGSGEQPGGAAVTLTKARTLTAQINSLSPGEYSGALRFAADEASEDAAEAKLPLLIQVRDPWAFPVLVIVLGSIFGWFTSKYVVGARKARDLSRQIKDLRARAEFLARPSPRSGWFFPSEAGSLGFARLSVELSRLARLTAVTTEVIFHGDEIEQLRQRAELRLVGLESLQKTRLLAQPFANGRPAAQLGIGRLLRSATNLLDRPTFGETERANLTKLLETIEAWTNEAKLVEEYRKVLIERRRGDQCPDKGAVERLGQGLPIRTQLEALLAILPTEKEIADEIGLTKLKQFDESISRILLLWREREKPWAAALADKYAAGEALEDLFKAVDMYIWDTLEKEKGQLTLTRQSISQESPRTYEVVEIDLGSDIEYLKSQDLIHHKLRVIWRVQPLGSEVRTTETDGCTLVQYFPSMGQVKITATLRWQGDPIAIPSPVDFAVIQSEEYGKHGVFKTSWTEFAALVVATLFATVTAIGTQYDATFGSFTQYLTMFIWAAGAGTGGNLFSQLGTTSAPGGASATIKGP
jgi:hypothetical protein